MIRLNDPRLRFLAVGAACAATHNAIVIGGAWLGLHYLAGIGVSYLVVVVLGYGLHVRFTFAEQAQAPSFPKYAVAMLANYPLTAALMFVGVGLMHLPVPIASPLATLMLVAWNYGASRWAITNRPFLRRRKPA